ncbi:hypothetical protein, partial [Staphylococcus capitis]|uniref:hypothetical protein n=1 Tax=Staphylococcus capitis TaxID=29388 RepID=UPI0021B1E682
MIKKLLHFSLPNKFPIFLILLLLILPAIYSSAKLKLQLLPHLHNPIISLQTTIPPPTPQSTEHQITTKIDNQLPSLPYLNT